MGRIIPYIMENKKMFQTTNQITILPTILGNPGTLGHLKPCVSCSVSMGMLAGSITGRM
jgi:hypothetical protein